MFDLSYIVYALFTIAWHLAIIAIITYGVYWAVRLILRLFEKHWFILVLIIGLLISWYAGVFDSLTTHLLY